MKDTNAYHINGPVPETPENDPDSGSWRETKVVGSRQQRVDAYERVSGTAVFPHDLLLPDMLHGALLRCPYPHAKVLSIDTSEAEKMPGVQTVITAKTPGADMPWYERRGKAYGRLFDNHCRHQGEEVAAVAAETPLQAADALRAIKVEYEQLPFVVDDNEALAADSPPVQEGGNRVGDPSIGGRGDVVAGFAEADVIVERTYTTPCQIHAPMEPHGSVAKWDGNRLTVWDSTQGVFGIQEGLSRALGLPMSNVRVIGHYMGGGFGAKLEMGKYTVCAALMARITGRAVKLFLTREDCFLVTGNRPGNRISVKLGASKDGTLTAIEYSSLGSTGAYPYHANTSTMAAYLYQCPNVRTEDTTVFTNAGKARPMRAPGFPQCAWALEQAIDELAAKLEIDPVKFRLRNLPEKAQIQDGIPYTSNELAACLSKGAESFGWWEARDRKPEESGSSSGFWGYSGGPPSTVIVKLFADGSVNLNMGASDIGTGTKTWAAMIVSEELGVAVDRIQIEHADTGTTQYATASGGSKTVPSDSPAVLAAAVAVKEQLLRHAAEQLEVSVDDLEMQNLELVSKTDPEKKLPVTEVERLGRQGVIVGTGYRDPNPEGKITWPFAAQFCEVEVNTRTGEVRLLRFLGAHDSGRVLNRLTFDNQVFGGIAMGVGFGLTEERVLDRQTGTMANANFHDYKVPTIMDVAASHACLPIDQPDNEFTSTGAKGLGEPATIATAAAIANAVADAVGIRLADGPITPEKLLEGIHAQGKEA
jgi:xanthine dehydrogenase YagR molybdenum-binding subunit